MSRKLSIIISFIVVWCLGVISGWVYNQPLIKDLYELDSKQNELIYLQDALIKKQQEELDALYYIMDKLEKSAPLLTPEERERAAQVIKYKSDETGITPDLILSVIKVESGFNPRARSPKGAVGLMQVHMKTWGKLYPCASRSIECNLNAGINILNEYIRLHNGDIKLALLSYNRGPGTVAKYMKMGRDPSNGYAKKVLTTYEQLEV